MTNYHINTETDRVNICKAQSVESCPLKDDNENVVPHFQNKQEAHSYKEKMLEQKYSSHNSLKKSSAKKPTKVTSSKGEKIVFKRREKVVSINQEQADELAQQMYDENQMLKNEFPADVFHSLHYYAGYGYAGTNQILRGNVNEKHRAGKFKKRYEDAPTNIKNIDMMMEKFGSGEGKEAKNLYRYRMFKNKTQLNNFLQELSSSGKFEDKAYISTSEDLGFIMGYVNSSRDEKDTDLTVIFEVVTNKGISMQDRPEENQSFMQSLEKERLLPRDMKFRVEGIFKQSMSLDESRMPVRRKYFWDRYLQAPLPVKESRHIVIRLVDEDLPTEND